MIRELLSLRVLFLLVSRSLSLRTWLLFVSRSLLQMELLSKTPILTLMLLLLETFKMNSKEMLLKKSLKILQAQVRKL